MSITQPYDDCVNSTIFATIKTKKEHDRYKVCYLACYSVISMWKLDKKPYFQY